MSGARVTVCAFTALALAGCVSTYELTLMPRTSGALYHGEAVEAGGAAQATVQVAIGDKTYTGTWVATAPDRTGGYVSGGWGSRRFGLGGTVMIDNPTGGEAKALLRAADDAGLRCDFKGVGAGQGGGTCQDDNGLIYDVQIRLKEKK